MLAKNLLLLLTFLTSTCTAFSQDKIDSKENHSDYVTTNTIPATIVKDKHPIRLSDFSSVYKKRKIVLVWKTLQEKDLKEFKLERSEDGKNFEQIALEKAKGNYSSGAYYEICDKKANAEVGYIYRLSEIDTEGKEHLLKYLENTVQNEQCKISLDNYAFKKNLSIKIDYKNVNETILRIVDKNGKVILIDHPKTTENDLNLEWLEEGIYTLKLATDSFELQKKITKI